jgi:TrmH family RNA methyltransferase
LAHKTAGKMKQSAAKRLFYTDNWQAAAAMLQRTKTMRGRSSTGFYAVFGTRMVKRALQSGVPIALVLHAGDYGRQHPADAALQAQLIAANQLMIPAPPDEMARLTAGRVRGAIAALLPLPDPPELAAFLRQVPSPLILIVVGIQDPGNLGALTRTAHAAGAHLLISSGPGDPFHPEGVRTSLGSLFKLPVLHQSWETTLPSLRAGGIELVAAVAAQGLPLPEHRFATGGTAIFMGSENAGLPPALTARIPRHLQIPMPAGVDSFSVNAAAAIFLYELQRQRREQLRK